MLMPNSYDYAIIRLVPRVEREEFINVGVILFCRTRRFLEARLAVNTSRLSAFAPDLDSSEIEQHLALIPLICQGKAKQDSAKKAVSKGAKAEKDQAKADSAQETRAPHFELLPSPASTI